MLAVLALAMMAMSMAGPLWSAQQQRDKEQELLRLGGLYARALSEYRSSAPGNLKQYPARLEQLVLDDRYIGTQRYLRRLYGDPVNGERPWGLVLDRQQRIAGVYSLSDKRPVASALAGAKALGAEAPTRYSDWKFMAEDWDEPKQ